MAKKIIVTMSDRTRWAIDADVVARDRAEHYAAEAARGSAVVYDRTHDETLQSDSLLLDWATNRMNWSDVEPWARFIPDQDKNRDYEEDWSSADKDILVVPDEEE